MLIDTSEITAEITPIDNSLQYMMKCKLIDNMLPLLEMDILVGEKADADLAKRNFKENASEIYMNILKLLN